MNKFFVFITIIFTITSPLKAIDNGLDSLMLIVDKTNNNKKLELLEIYTRKYPTNVELIKEFAKEAKKQSNYLYLAAAYKSNVYLYTRMGNQDSIRLYLNLTDETIRLFDNKNDIKKSAGEKKIYDNIMKMLYTTKTAFYLHEGKYDLALLEINRALENPQIEKNDDFENQLYNLSGIGYLNTKKYDEALACFEEAYKLIIKIADKNNIGKYSYYMSLEGMGAAYAGMGKYDEAVLITDTLISKIEEERKNSLLIHGENAEDNFVYNYFKHQALIYSARWDIKINELERARIKLNQVDFFLKENFNMNSPHTDFHIYYIVEAEYHLETQEYNISEKYITSLIDRLSIKEQYPLYYTANELLAKVLNVQGKGQKSYEIISDLNRVNDSINTINFSNQLAEINILYEVDKSKMLAEQKELELKNTQTILTVILIGFLISLLIIYFIYQNRKKIVEKNRQLYNQYKSIEDRDKKIRELQNIKNGLTDKGEGTSDLYQVLIDKLDKYMEETNAFLNSDINREELALELCTNRQYLIEAIKEKTNKTFNEYIYSYRLKFAYELIVSDKEKTINEVINESGFTTRATFYKMFKATYGLTPSELRGLL